MYLPGTSVPSRQRDTGLRSGRAWPYRRTVTMVVLVRDTILAQRHRPSEANSLTARPTSLVWKPVPPLMPTVEDAVRLNGVIRSPSSFGAHSAKLMLVESGPPPPSASQRRYSKAVLLKNS